MREPIRNRLRKVMPRACPTAGPARPARILTTKTRHRRAISIFLAAIPPNSRSTAVS